MESLLQDLRQAVRAIRRKPGWAAIVALTLAFGIGANTAVFTFVNGALFQPPRVARPGELVWLNAIIEGRRNQAMSYPDYVQFRERVAEFTGAVAWEGTAVALGGNPPRRVRGMMVSAGFFDVLGVQPVLGRGFAAVEESERGAHPVVVLGHRLWKVRFGLDPRVLDSTIIVNGQPFQVIGVAPEGFHGVDLEEPPELFLPLGMLNAVMPGMSSLLDGANSRWLRTVARLRPGVPPARAAAATALVASTLHRGDSESERIGAELTPVLGQLDPNNRRGALPVLTLLSLVPLLVLGVACANVASLLVARGFGRRREVAMRRALGASRWRLVRQMLTESVVLSGVAGLAGMVLASWILTFIIRMGQIPPEVTIAMVPDGRVLGVTMGLALLTGVAFGILPALAVTGPSLTPALKDDSAAATAGRERHRLRDGFVIAQVTASLVLLITAGLFLRSLAKAFNVDPGFDVTGVASVQFDVRLQGYSSERQRAFHRQLLERVGTVPGVVSAAYATVVPMTGRSYGTDAYLVNGPPSGGISTRYTEVSPGYLGTMGIGLLQGRDFTGQDESGNARVVIVNQMLAERLWPGEDPIGRELRMGSDGPPRVVVGVARDGQYERLVRPPRPFAFLPIAQQTGIGEVTLMAKTSGSPDALVGAIVGILREMDPNLPVGRAESMRKTLANGADVQRAVSVLLGLFGVIALGLAALGIYGVTSLGVTQRVREIGIRMSLGAKAPDIVALFMRSALRLSVVGSVIGVVVSAGVSGLLASFLFGLTATDGVTFASAALVLTGVVAVASYLPARRATRVDPMVALRSE